VGVGEDHGVPEQSGTPIFSVLLLLTRTFPVFMVHWSIKMYLMLIGQIIGLSLAIAGHSFLAGKLHSQGLYAMPLMALMILFVAADIETFAPDHWKARINERVKAGVLRRSFCFGFGMVIGVLVYPIEWLAWAKIFRWEARTRAGVGIVIGTLAIAISCMVGWFLLTRYPRAQRIATE